MESFERDLLRFVAAHRLVSSDQVAVLAGDKDDDPAASARRLVADGLLSRTRLVASGPDCLVITEAGLAAIESRLTVPVWEMREMRPALAAGSVWVRAQDGRFTGLKGVVSHREMVFHDSELPDANSTTAGRVRPYGIRIAGRRPIDGSGLHHPEVLLQFWDGWAAVEFALGGASPHGLAAQLTAYGVDDRFGRVVFLVEEERVAVEIEAAAVSAGVASVTMVQWMEFA